MENYEKLLKYFFANEEDMDAAHLPKTFKARLLRLRSVYAYWLNNPMRNHKDIVAALRDRYGLTDTTAYADLGVIKAALGEFNRCTPDYLRWVFLQRCEEGFRRARENDDANAFSRVLATFGKYCRLDKDDAEAPDYSVIKPETFEISANPEDAGYQRIPDLEKKTRELLRKYDLSGTGIAVPEEEEETETEEYVAPEYD